MKKLTLKSLIYFFLLLIGGLISCSKSEQKVLNFSVSAVDVQSSGEAQTISINANVDWTISQPSDASWLSVSPRSGSGAGEVKIQAQPNITGQSRSAQLILSTKVDESLKSSITITQVPVTLSFSQDPVEIKSEGGSFSFNVVSNTSWEILTSSETARVKLSTLKGNGNTTITGSIDANPIKKIVEIPLRFSYFGIHKTLTLKQEAGPNNAPGKPSIIYPTNGLNEVITNLTFKWSCIDPDEDPLDFYIMLSKDKSNYTSYGPFKDMAVVLDKDLDLNTKYYVKIKADDKCGGVTESDVVEFTTAATSAYYDGDVVPYMVSSKSNPVILVFTGDGYVQSDMGKEKGLFDRDVNEAIEAFFAVEPYKTYRDYFTVYKVVAVSAESGASYDMQDKKVNKSTAFSSVYKGGTSMEINSEKVFNYAKKVPGVTDNVLKNSAIVVAVNENHYGGTCFMWTTGESIAICPVSRQGSETSMTYFHSVVNHEAGGHGWGRLADEYINYTGQTIPADEVESLKYWQSKGASLNVATSGVAKDALWADFIGREGYSRVGMFQGANYYSYGVWRCEDNCCMINNLHYYSVICRYLQVKRIMDVVGEQFTLEKFIEKDVQKAPANTKTEDMKDFIPLAPPVLMGTR